VAWNDLAGYGRTMVEIIDLRKCPLALESIAHRYARDRGNMCLMSEIGDMKYLLHLAIFRGELLARRTSFQSDSEMPFRHRTHSLSL
jgi:hypothetical protein